MRRVSILGKLLGRLLILNKVLGRFNVIDKQYGEYVLSCDICGESVGDFDSFDEAETHTKENGWVISKKDGEWLNLCPQCID